VDACDEDTDGCTNTGNDALCDDGLYCNGAEVCGPAGCEAGTPPLCDDGVSCTVDACDEDTDGCTNAGNDALCDDGNGCNGAEICNPALGCESGSAPDAAVSLSLPDQATGAPASTIVVPVLAVPAAGTTIDLVVTFDPGVLQAQDVSATTLSAGFTIDSDLSTPGQAAFSITGTSPLTGAGAIADVEFLVVGSSGESTPLTLGGGTIDGGAISSCLDSGRFQLCDAVPAEVQGLVAQGLAPTTLSWDGQPGEIRYDVAAGLLSTLLVDRSSARASCLADDLQLPTYVDERPPPVPGDGYYYLPRAQDGCATGSYGDSSAGEERLPAPSCP
jgi:hypothetical protein